MARIPDQLGLEQVSGAQPSMATVAPTDFGLERAGATLESVAMGQRRVAMLGIRAQAAQDRQAAAPQVLALKGANDQAYMQDAAAFTGGTGFAQDQIDAAQKRATDARAAYAKAGASPGQLAEFDNMSRQETLRIGGAAYDYQAKVNAAPAMEAAANSQQSQVNGAYAGFLGAFGPQRDALMLGHAAGDTDLPDKVGQAFDAEAAKAVATLPAFLQPKLQAELATERLKQVIGAQDFQLQHAEGAVTQAASDQMQALANGVVSSPASFDTASTTLLPKIVQTLPAGLQDAAKREGMAQLAQARVKGLIQAGQGAAALKELDAGAYDAWLKPDQKESLRAAASSDDDNLDKALAADRLRQRMEADEYSRATTGRGILQPVELDGDALKLVGPKAVADHMLKADEADRAFVATGAIGVMSNADLAAAAARPAPQPSDPNYVADTQTWEIQQKAAQAQLKARAEPGQWAFTSTEQKLNGQPMGAALLAMWKAATTPGPAQGPAMAAYAHTMLQVQTQAGIAPRARQILPQQVAASLAANVVNAPPEQKLAAMQSLAALVRLAPDRQDLTDGTTASPRAMLAQQLMAAHLTGAEVSAIVDYGDDPARLGRFVAALNDPTLKGVATGKDAAALTSAVRAQMTPFLASVGPLPGGQGLAQARLDRTVLIAKELMASQHLNVGQAAAAAAADMSPAGGAYRYVDGWRMPAQLASAGGLLGPLAGLAYADGAAHARTGAASILGDLTASGGKGLYAPAGLAANPDQARALYASQIEKSGRWVTLPDDSGLTLMVPKPDGQWTQVTDRWGRAVRASWSQLEGVRGGQASPFAAPPPGAHRTEAGVAVPAFSRSAGFAALAASVETQESGANPAQISPKGAIGAMQLMPDTGARYAHQIGLAWDPERALHDAAYNRQIGRAALADLTARYMTGSNSAAGIGLALAAYNAGEGRLTGWRDARGYHPGWLTTLGDPRSGRISLTDWVKAIPIPETRNYVTQVLRRAVAHAGGV